MIVIIGSIVFAIISCGVYVGMCMAYLNGVLYTALLENYSFPIASAIGLLMPILIIGILIFSLIRCAKYSSNCQKSIPFYLMLIQKFGLKSLLILTGYETVKNLLTKKG